MAYVVLFVSGAVWLKMCQLCVCMIGYCFLLFQDELSVQALTEACIVEDSKMYWCVTSPTMKDKLVLIIYLAGTSNRLCLSLDAFHVHCRLCFVNGREVVIFQNFCYSLAQSLTHSFILSSILPFITLETLHSLQLDLVHGTDLHHCFTAFILLLPSNTNLRHFYTMMLSTNIARCPASSLDVSRHLHCLND